MKKKLFMCKDNSPWRSRLFSCFFQVLFTPLLLLISQGACSLQAQILNIEQHRLESDTASDFKFKGTMGLQVFNRSAAADNPVNLFGFNSDINALYAPGRHAFIAIGHTNYLEINDAPWLNFGFAHLRAHFYQEERFSFETYGQYSYDNFRGLDPRLLAGANFRYAFVQNKQVETVFGLGPLLESERWTHPNTEEIREVQFLKLSSYFIYRHSISKWVDLNAIAYYQTGYDSGISAFRHRVSGALNINTRLSTRWSLNNSLHFSYEDKPIVPITKGIFDLRIGLSLDL
jgi:hypothetical protein